MSPLSVINQNYDDGGGDIHVAVMAHNDKWKNDDVMMMQLLIFMRLAVMAHNVDREEIGVWSHLILA